MEDRATYNLWANKELVNWVSTVAGRFPGRRATVFPMLYGEDFWPERMQGRDGRHTHDPAFTGPAGKGNESRAPGRGPGVARALALTRVLSSLLYGVAPTDPTTFALPAALLSVLALPPAIYRRAERRGSIQ